MNKLSVLEPVGTEFNITRNYIDWIASLPWGKASQDQFSLSKSAKILDEDHYGLKKIKERILEYLAVQALTKKLKGPVLCFVAPAKNLVFPPALAPAGAAPRGSAIEALWGPGANEP